MPTIEPVLKSFHKRALPEGGFWLDKCGPLTPDKCWKWRGAHSRTWNSIPGGARMSIAGTQKQPWRWFYPDLVDWFPEPATSCGNHKCVNPHHRVTDHILGPDGFWHKPQPSGDSDDADEHH